MKKKKKGMLVLTADTPEDIDKWPPASEVFACYATELKKKKKFKGKK